ncbi:hypothetical protein [Serratia sp. (in: enterobacteria)]|uniref:hypothetical protein n=1 Tax=Serratia sp. (in: enterobacteria) TaxID=616 RepID=UPI0039893F0B
MKDNDNHFYEKGVQSTSSTDGSLNPQQGVGTEGENSVPSPDLSDDNEFVRKLNRVAESSTFEYINEKMKKDRLVPADFKWLKGNANERAIFWVWLLLKTLPKKNNLTFIYISQRNSSEWGRELSDGDILYEYFRLPNEACSTVERSRIIIDFFNALEKQSDSITARNLLTATRSIWANVIYPVRRVQWLNKKSESELDGIWDHLLKKNGFENCILNEFRPVDNNERRLAIIGAIDNYISYGDSRDINTKKAIIEEVYKNFLQTKRREKIAAGNKKAGLNAEISQKAKKALVKMTEEKDTRINKFLEKLILDEYSRYNNKN